MTLVELLHVVEPCNEDDDDDADDAGIFQCCLLCHFSGLEKNLMNLMIVDKLEVFF